jgi:hypothetical protein
MSHSLGDRDKQDGRGAEPSGEGDSHAAMMYFYIEADAYGAPGSYTRQDLERLRRKRWPEKASR